MAELKDCLTLSSLKAIKASNIKPGSIFHGPMEGVDHGKFFIIAGISDDKCCVCSVVINSQINLFIQNRPKLLACQFEIKSENYEFLKHNSYVNCATPLQFNADVFNQDSFEYKDKLESEHLDAIINHIKNSGSLSENDINLFFN